jgi:serpin B
VKQQTEGKIDQILDHLDANTMFVLLNAVYFKGTWLNKFDENNTHDDFFHVSASKEVAVPFMRQKAVFHLVENADFQAISLPYSGNNLSMVIILPKEAGLRALEKQLSPDKLKDWLSQLDAATPRKVELTIPKYKLDIKYDLIPPCKDLGIYDAFDIGLADFGGMGFPQGQIYISQIKHRAYIEVNEEGSEAAAATAVELATRGMTPNYPIFRADHPYLVIIRHNATGTILFMGRIVDPNKAT